MKIHSFETFGAADGPGVRFIVFLHGCAFRCAYCHNPDTWASAPAFEMGADDVLKRALRYRSYWREEGGITVSGGEPMLQAESVAELFEKAHAAGVTTCLDTSGGPFSREPAKFAAFERLFAATDTVLLDLKLLDPDAHRRLTGADNASVLDCARYLAEKGKNVWIRRVLVPGVTDGEEDLRKTGEFIRSLGNVTRLDVLPYHTLGVSKWRALGLPYALDGVEPPTDAQVVRARELIGELRAASPRTAAADEFFAFAADVLGVAADALSFETTYGSIPEWDSMAQLRLVTEMEARWGVAIPFADVTRATSLWELYRRLNALSPKKAVALDLDGTLWDGVVGEDGVAALRPKTAFLAELKALKERGVLLTILSKNNEEDAKAAFDAGLLSPLAADDFLFPQVNWAPKAENLAALAKELNLGLDAFVFVDDNPAERLEMAARLPDVAVAAFPPVLSAYFPEGGTTDEDRRKTEEYREEAARRKFLASGPADVWSALGAWCDVHPMRDDEAARVAQLSQKANQFSVCTNRYTADEVAALARDPETRVYVVRAGDKFGDQGLVAFVVVKDGEILDWTMSCRVAGRGLETRAWAEIARDLAARGVRDVRATWRDSGRNAPVRDLFARLGFEEKTTGEASDGRRSATFYGIIRFQP